MCWFLGLSEPNIQSLNKKCINKWIYSNEELKVNIITNENIQYCVPEYIDIIENRNINTLEAMRVNLIY